MFVRTFVRIDRLFAAIAFCGVASNADGSLQSSRVLRHLAIASLIQKERIMITVRRERMALFVHRTSQQWIVRDPEGHFWMLPMGDNAWDNREPFSPTKETELESVPGHYMYMF